MSCRISNDDFLELLRERLKYNTDDEDVIEMYMYMYERYVEEGCFEYNDQSISAIVDNDYVNWCDIISEGEEYWDEIWTADSKSETEFEHGIIEAINRKEKYALIRWN